MFGVSRKEFYQVLGRLDALRYDLNELERRVKETCGDHQTAITELQRDVCRVADGLTDAGVMHYERSGWRKGPPKKAK